MVCTPGQGREFTLYLPRMYSQQRTHRKLTYERYIESNAARSNGFPLVTQSADAAQDVDLVNEWNDDRDAIGLDDHVLLIVENDQGFARILLDAAREKGFKALVTALGSEALALSHQYKPSAITLDMFLPDMQGWRVLDRLKHDLQVRHIPVCVISTDDARDRSLDSGAMGFIGKPMQSREILDTALDELHRYVSRTQRSLLLIMKAGDAREQLIQFIANDGIDVFAVDYIDEACSMLRAHAIDCLVLHENAGDLEPEQLAQIVAARSTLRPLPFIVYQDSSQPLSEAVWLSYRENLLLREAHSLPRLLDLTMSLLHRPAQQISENQRAILEALHEADRPLANRKVLIVDDDMRNIFALAAVLEEHSMVHVWAENGRDAINLVGSDPSIDIVLMDIMMPEMDGMETMQEIRKLPVGRDLPIIAVTAKAMKGDREKCIEAGAWDYLSKPVNTNALLTVLRAWLHR